VGPPCQRQKEREKVTIQEREGNGLWDVFGCGLESVPRALSSFSFSFLFYVFI
jgi:hypothetical protein